MYTLGLLIGIYGYGILLLGLCGILYAPIIWIYTLLFFVGSGLYLRKIGVLKKIRKFKGNLAQLLLIFILSLQLLVNFIGALGPEVAFDALWYHLTIPKIYLFKHMIVHIPGGLLYYSDMPKFIELLYAAGLTFGGAVLPKLIHFTFSILILVVLYQLSRKFLSKTMSVFVLLIFAANLVVGWESISAYIDLGRTFFELLSFSALINFLEEKEKKWFFYSAIFMGFAIATKLLAIESLVMMSVIIGISLYRKSTVLKLTKTVLTYAGVALLISLPWFVFSLVSTGNPIYPFFSHTYPISFPFQLLYPFYFVSSFWNLFLYSADPINPMYLMVLPLICIFFSSWNNRMKTLVMFVAGGLFFWYITPRTGGGRFILPYLPVFSLISVFAILSLNQKWLKKLLFALVIIISLSSIGYRAISNAKFIPVLVGKESSTAFLATHLNFSFGDFVDTDGYFKHHIKPTDTVLLYGFHNLYYVDFPFIDASWVTKGNVFTYIATQNTGLPRRFENWNLIYRNPVTHVSLYSAGGIPWVY